MKIKYIRQMCCSWLMLLCAINLSAQKEANWWHFGSNAGLNFNILQNGTPTTGGTVSNIPRAVTGPLNTWEGCFTISDTNGNLMMSGDGSTIWNKNNLVMPNATGLGGNSSATQSGIIIPIPGSKTRYYSLSVDYERHAGGIQYAIIDMSLNGGLGGIITKNQKLLASPTDENIAAVRKINSENWWLVHKKQNTTTGVTIYVWEVTPSGISSSPNTYNYNFTLGTSNGVGILKFSSDGSRFVSTNYGGNNIIFGNFNPVTGIPSNVDRVDWGTNTYGIEFSPIGNYVYTCFVQSTTRLTTTYQIPWNSLKNKSITDRIALPFQASNIQLGLDGRIYGVRDVTRNLYVILEPEKKGLACDMRQFTNYLTNNAGLGLPTFSASFFNTKISGNSFACRGNNLQYTVEISFAGPVVDHPVRLEWNWGDGTTTQNQPIVSEQTIYKLGHNYTIPGTYTITVTPYKTGNIALNPVRTNITAINCKLKVNRMIRLNLPNTAEQNINQ